MEPVLYSEDELPDDILLTPSELCKQAEVSRKRMTAIHIMNDDTFVKMAKNEQAALFERNLAYYRHTTNELVLNDRHDLKLNFVPDLSKSGYAIDLDQFHTGHEFIHFLFHLKEKEWFTAQMQADMFSEFMRALKHTFKDWRTATKWDWQG